ncbi:hypothetical protein HMPREF1989_01615, partial [Porphyromonas gingivalis F0566]
VVPFLYIELTLKQCLFGWSKRVARLLFMEAGRPIKAIGW